MGVMVTWPQSRGRLLVRGSLNANRKGCPKRSTRSSPHRRTAASHCKVASLRRGSAAVT